jgi:hypothetical protein
VKIRAIRVKFRLLPKKLSPFITIYQHRNFMNTTPKGGAGRHPQTIHGQSCPGVGASIQPFSN